MALDRVWVDFAINILLWMSEFLTSYTYNSLGQLVCVVCSCQVKSELLWNAHLQGRTHKEVL